MQRPPLARSAHSHIGQCGTSGSATSKGEFDGASQSGVRRTRSHSNHRHSLQPTPIPPTLLDSPLITCPSSPFHRRSCSSTMPSFSAVAVQGSSLILGPSAFPPGSPQGSTPLPSSNLFQSRTYSTINSGSSSSSTSTALTMPSSTRPKPILIPARSSTNGNGYNPARSPTFSSYHHSSFSSAGSPPDHLPLPSPTGLRSSQSPISCSYPLSPAGSHSSASSCISVPSSSASSSPYYVGNLPASYPHFQPSSPILAGESSPPLYSTLDSLLLRPLQMPTGSKRSIQASFAQGGGDEVAAGCSSTRMGSGDRGWDRILRLDEGDGVEFEPGPNRWGEHGLE